MRKTYMNYLQFTKFLNIYIQILNLYMSVFVVFAVNCIYTQFKVK